MSNSSDRIAVVIGAASGIGWATARALAADGCRVTLADRNLDGARAKADELGEPHTAAEVDVADEGSVPASSNRSARSTSSSTAPGSAASG